MKKTILNISLQNLSIKFISMRTRTSSGNHSYYTKQYLKNTLFDKISLHLILNFSTKITSMKIRTILRNHSYSMVVLYFKPTFKWLKGLFSPKPILNYSFEKFIPLKKQLQIESFLVFFKIHVHKLRIYFTKVISY